jgi:hypothetical protein
MKYLKHESEIIAKHLKTVENHCKHIQHSDKNTCNICVKHMQHPDKHTCNIRLKIDETLGTEVRNIRVQSLQHSYETLAAYL